MAIPRMTGLGCSLIAGLLLLSGCSLVAPPEDGPVSLALSFKPQQQFTFRATHETSRSVQWRGVSPSDGKAFKGGTTGQTLVIVFDEKVLSVDPNGQAALEITVKELKCKAIAQDRKVVDYDSTQNSVSNTALAGLVGQRYVIHMTVSGHVLTRIDADTARVALDKNAAQYQLALKLLTDRAIQRRHAIKSFPENSPASLAPGLSWSAPQTFSFSMMGKRTFTKNYTFKGVESQGDARFARVDMTAVPSVTPPQQDDKSGALMQMFDNTHQYTGHMDLDVNRGRVRSQAENMEINWAYLDASSVDRAEQEEPKSVHMTALENIRLECLD